MGRPARHLRIVLVQDRPGASARLKGQLESLGHELIGLARSRREAIQKVRGLSPDLVIIDLRLNGIGGVAAARTIFATHPVPIILLVGHDATEFVSRAREAGVMALLVTPADTAQLAPIIDLALERYREFQAIRADSADIQHALTIRNDIEQAKRILMRCLQISEPEAFRRLWRSRTAVSSLGELADAIVRSHRLLRDGRLVIRSHNAHLEEGLRRLGNLTVIVDGRNRERRADRARVPVERRHAHRRG